jgi:hypothetical protein
MEFFIYDSYTRMAYRQLMEVIYQKVRPVKNKLGFLIESKVCRRLTYLRHELALMKFQT